MDEALDGLIDMSSDIENHSQYMEMSLQPLRDEFRIFGFLSCSGFELGACPLREGTGAEARAGAEARPFFGAGAGAEARLFEEGFTSEGSIRFAEADVGAGAGAVVDAEAGAEVGAIKLTKLTGGSDPRYAINSLIII